MPIFGKFIEHRYALCPAGLHQAVLVDVVDRGFKETQFGPKHQLLFAWQIADVDPATGRRFDVIRVCNNSMDPKATLRQMFESWRGAPYSDAEVRAGVDFELAIGGNCTINVVHRIDPAGIEHANVTAVLPAMKNIAPLAPLNYTRAKDRPPRPDAPPVFTPVNLATPTQAPLVPVPPVPVLSEADDTKADIVAAFGRTTPTPPRLTTRRSLFSGSDDDPPLARNRTDRRGRRPASCIDHPQHRRRDTGVSRRFTRETSAADHLASLRTGPMMTPPGSDYRQDPRRTGDRLHRADALVEVWVLKTPYRTVSGYFDSLDAAVMAVTEAVTVLNGNSTFYLTLNPVRPDVHARAANRLKSYAVVTTANRDILRRAWLLIDVDPARPSGVSSTEAELALAMAVRDAVVAWLTAQGWPAPILAMSGNGGHALYAIDLPNDDSTRDLVKACLEAIFARFATPAVSIDRAVYNAARISKLYGTVARKGDPTSDRPHRLATIDAAPPRVCVTSTQLAALAALQPAAPPTPARVPVFMSGNIPASRPSPGLIGSYRPSPRLDMRAEFAARGWYLREIRPGWHAVRCPWIAAHSSASGDRETAIREPDTPDAVWGFKCLHDHCASRTYRDVWELFQPAPEPLNPASPFTSSTALDEGTSCGYAVTEDARTRLHASRDCRGDRAVCARALRVAAVQRLVCARRRAPGRGQ